MVYWLNVKGHKDRTEEFIFSEGIWTSKLQTIWRWWRKPDTLISLAARRQNWHKLQQSLNFLEQLPHFWTRYLSNTNPSHVGSGPSTGRIFHPISVREHLVIKWCSFCFHRADTFVIGEGREVSGKCTLHIHLKWRFIVIHWFFISRLHSPVVAKLITALVG